jgi:hypothetical protein
MFITAFVHLIFRILIFCILTWINCCLFVINTVKISKLPPQLNEKVNFMNYGFQNSRPEINTVGKILSWILPPDNISLNALVSLETT